MTEVTFDFPTKNSRIGKVFIVRDILALNREVYAEHDEKHSDVVTHFEGLEEKEFHYSLLWHTGELQESIVTHLDDLFNALRHYILVNVHEGMSGCADYAVYYTDKSIDEIIAEYNKKHEDKPVNSIYDLICKYSIFHRNCREEMEVKDIARLYTMFHETMSGYYELPPLLLTEEETKNVIKLLKSNGVAKLTDDKFALVKFAHRISEALKLMYRASPDFRANFERIIKELKSPELYYYYKWMLERYEIWLNDYVGLVAEANNNYSVFHFSAGNPDTVIEVKLPKMRRRNIQVYRGTESKYKFMNMITTGKFAIYHSRTEDKDVAYLEQDDIVNCYERYRDIVHQPAVISKDFFDKFQSRLMNSRLGDLLFFDFTRFAKYTTEELKRFANNEIPEEVVEGGYHHSGEENIAQSEWNRYINNTDDITEENTAKLQIINGHIDRIAINHTDYFFLVPASVDIDEVVIYHPEHGTLKLSSWHLDDKNVKIPTMYLVRRVPYIEAEHGD